MDEPGDLRREHRQGVGPALGRRRGADDVGLQELGCDERFLLGLPWHSRLLEKAG